MPIEEFFERCNATDAEQQELRWFLLFLRWRHAVETLTPVSGTGENPC